MKLTGSENSCRAGGVFSDENVGRSVEIDIPGTRDGEAESPGRRSRIAHRPEEDLSVGEPGTSCPDEPEESDADWRSHGARPFIEPCCVSDGILDRHESGDGRDSIRREPEQHPGVSAVTGNAPLSAPRNRTRGITSPPARAPEADPPEAATSTWRPSRWDARSAAMGAAVAGGRTVGRSSPAALPRSRGEAGEAPPHGERGGAGGGPALMKAPALAETWTGPRPGGAREAGPVAHSGR